MEARGEYGIRRPGQVTFAYHPEAIPLRIKAKISAISKEIEN